MFSKILTATYILTITVTLVWHINVAEAQFVKEGLVSYWSFDKATIKDGIAKDSQGNNDGTINGEPKVVAGKIGEALEFDGEKDYVKIPSSDSLITKEVTMEVWVKFDSLPTDEDPGGLNTIFGGHPYELHLTQAGQAQVWTSTSGPFDSNSTLKMGVWYHLVGTYDSSKQAIYINGIKDIEGESKGAIELLAFELHIGADDGDIRHVDGIIDEACVYNRVLSGDEVKQNFETAEAVSPAEKLSITWGKIKEK